jgi:NitT/TauT family transport system substrate-binding protein
MTRLGRSAGSPQRLLVALSAVVLLAGCGGAPDPVGPSAPPSPDPAPGALEKTNLQVGVLSVVDVAALERAKSAGYFSAEGLNVDLVPIQGGAFAVPKLTSGELDLSWVGWPSAILAQSQGLSDFRLLPEGYSTAPGSFQIMTVPGSAITGPHDLAGKTIATNSIKSITDLMARSAMQSAGVDASTVQFVELPFPDMIGALQAGQIDGAILPEPFITLAVSQLKAVPVLDVTAGADTNDLSIAGMAGTAKWAQQHPNTLAAFERALAKAQAEMSSRKLVEQVLPTYTSIRSDTVAQLALGSWPTTLDASKLQRVSDLMQQFGVLTRYFDVGPMLALSD